MNIDGDDTSTDDCDLAPNLVPLMIDGLNKLGDTANFDNVNISLTHSYTGDLTISLVSPSGTESVLLMEMVVAVMII